VLKAGALPPSEAKKGQLVECARTEACVPPKEGQKNPPTSTSGHQSRCEDHSYRDTRKVVAQTLPFPNPSPIVSL